MRKSYQMKIGLTIEQICNNDAKGRHVEVLTNSFYLRKSFDYNSYHCILSLTTIARSFENERRLAMKSIAFCPSPSILDIMDTTLYKRFIADNKIHHVRKWLTVSPKLLLNTKKFRIDCYRYWLHKSFNFMRYTLLVLCGDVLFKILWCPYIFRYTECSRQSKLWKLQERFSSESVKKIFSHLLNKKHVQAFVKHHYLFLTSSDDKLIILKNVEVHNLKEKPTQQFLLKILKCNCTSFAY